MRTRFLAGAAAIGTVVGCSDATAPKATGTLEGATVIRARVDKNFTEKARFVIAGRRVSPGVCAYERRTRVYEGDHFTERVAEFDPTTCMFVVARGDHTPHANPEAGFSQKMTQVGDLPTASISQTPQFSPTPKFSLVSQARHSHWQRLFHEDPGQIDVTASKIHFDFSMEFGCAYAWGSRHYMQWFTDSGWYHLDDTHFMSPRGQCKDVVYARATASFRNQQFCYPGTTDAWYTVNEIEGRADGSSWMRHAGYASGACSDFLNYMIEYCFDGYCNS